MRRIVDAGGSPSPPSSSRRFPRLGREPSEADRVRKGGARERAKLSPQGGSGVERTLRRRNPPVRGSAPNRGRADPNSPSFRGRSPWNPPSRGRAVYHRSPSATNGGIPAQSARMTCRSVSAQQGAVRPWTRRPKFSVIQRPQAVESHNEGHTPIRGRARVALSSVILAKR